MDMNTGSINFKDEVRYKSQSVLSAHVYKAYICKVMYMYQYEFYVIN